MKAAIIKRKNCFDIMFLTEDNEILDIYEVEDVKYYDSIDAFEQEVFSRKEKQNPEKEETETVLC